MGAGRIAAPRSNDPIHREEPRTPRGAISFALCFQTVYGGAGLPGCWAGLSNKFGSHPLIPQGWLSLQSPLLLLINALDILGSSACSLCPIDFLLVSVINHSPKQVSNRASTSSRGSPDSVSLCRSTPCPPDAPGTDPRRPDSPSPAPTPLTTPAPTSPANQPGLSPPS